MSLPSGVKYDTQPLPIATNHRLPWASNEPPSRNWPCGVPLTSANFSTGPTPAGNGGSPQGWTKLGACALAVPPGPARAQPIPSSAVAMPRIRVRDKLILFPPSDRLLFDRGLGRFWLHDPVAAQPVDIRSAHPEPFAEHLGGVLAEQRRRLDRGRGAVEAH